MADWHPGEILATSGGYWRSCALHAAVRLDLFSLIGDEQLSAGEVAQRAGTSKRGTGVLLDALAALQLVTKHDGQYRNSDASRQWLCSDSPRCLCSIIRHHSHLVQGWGRLDEAVTSGAPLQRRSSFSEEEQRQDFLRGMFNLASLIAPRLVPAIDLGGRRRLLDLGGGPGTYAVHFCRHNPDLEAVVFDLPTSAAVAEETIGRLAMAGRISFTGGNYLTDTLPAGCDVAWLSHILHGEGPDECAEIIAKTAAALAPGGLLLVHEFILDDSKDGPLFPALFSLP